MRLIEHDSLHNSIAFDALNFSDNFSCPRKNHTNSNHDLLFMIGLDFCGGK